MEKLKGKTILIGKEPGQGRLIVAISGTGKAAVIGTPGCVPNCVSRCKPAENVAHAKITIDQGGNLTLSNMKSQNVTFVNGAEIASKRIDSTSTVELGKDRFPVNVPMILETARKIVGAPIPNPGSGPHLHPEPPEPGSKKFNISHLKHVWDDFHDKGMEIKKKQKEQGIYASLPMFFTMGGGALTFVLSFILGDEYKAEIQMLSGILVVAGLAMLAYSFVRRKNDTSIEELEQISEDFQLRYVCPNPDCNKFFGAISYKLLKNQLRSHKDQKMYCPRCGCELVEK